MQCNELNRKLDALARQTRQAIDLGHFEEAEGLIKNVLTSVENHSVALIDLAYVKMKLNQLDEAYSYGKKALACSKTPVDAYIYDMLAEITNEMKRFEESNYFGKLAIATKKEEVRFQTAFTLPDQAAPGLSQNKEANIISYSLFGTLPRYCETAILNVDLAKEIYPEWTCRFYVNHTVPKQVLVRLEKAGAQVVIVDDEEQKNTGLFWRFYVMDDADVQCFLIRDADSVLSNKERAAVDAWLNSGKWFHIMRDHYNHTELILAGMWGGYNGVFKNTKKSIQQHYQQLNVINKTIDQDFLRYFVWPTVAQSVMTHDSRHLSKECLPYPDYVLSEIEQTPYFHIGMIDAHVLTTRVFIDDLSASQVLWYLVDENGDVVCHYEAEIYEQGKLELQLPYAYSLKVKRGIWQIYTQVLK